MSDATLVQPKPSSDRDGAAAQGVAYLRNRTVRRATVAYVRWIGRSVGWWSILYLVFWVVIFAISGYQSLPRPATPLDWPLPEVFAAATALLLLMGAFSRHTPPLSLGRTDVYRLALSPARPWLVLRWPFLRALLGRVLLGLFLGGVWTVLAGAWFGVTPWWAAAVIALLLSARLCLNWLLYAGTAPTSDTRTGTPLLLAAGALALVGVAAPAWGLAAGLYSSQPTVLIAPLLLASMAFLQVRGSLDRLYPTNFIRQSFILSQLQALRTFEMMSRLAGGSVTTDPGERQRLRALLLDRPHAVRPRRSLPAPSAQGQAWAIAWRVASGTYRLPLLSLLGKTLFLGVAVAVALVAGGAVGLFAAAALLAMATAGLLGGSGYSAHLPLEPLARTLGRIGPALLLVLGFVLVLTPVLASQGWLPASGQLTLVLTLVPLVLVTLEKASRWTGSTGPEATIAAAALAAGPVFITGGLGAPGLALPVQLVLLVIIALLPV